VDTGRSAKNINCPPGNAGKAQDPVGSEATGVIPIMEERENRMSLDLSTFNGEAARQAPLQSAHYVKSGALFPN
jgi:hypothetical protein